MYSPSVTSDARVMPVGAAGGQVEQMLADARLLIDAAMDRHRLSADLPGEITDARDSAVRLALRAEHQIVCLVPALRSERVLLDGLPEVVAQVVRGGTGVQGQLLYATRGPAPAADEGGPARTAGRDGPQVRAVHGLFPELLIVDQRFALVRHAGQVSQIELPSVLHALQALFAAGWALARPTDPQREACRHRECRQTRAVLQPLSAGLADDAAARALNLSVRTYRRCVADIMRRLGATTRFQAGVRAAASAALCLHEQETSAH